MTLKTIRLITKSPILFSTFLCILLFISNTLVAQNKQIIDTGNGSANLNSDTGAVDRNFLTPPGRDVGDNEMFSFSGLPNGPKSIRYRYNTPFSENHGSPRYRGMVPGKNSVSYIEIDGAYYAYKGGPTLRDKDKVSSLPPNRIYDGFKDRDLAGKRSEPSPVVVVGRDTYEDGTSYPASVSGVGDKMKIVINDPDDGHALGTYDVFRPIPASAAKDTAVIAAVTKAYKDGEKAFNTKNVGDWLAVKNGSVYTFTFSHDLKTVSVSTESIEEAKGYYIIPK